MSKNSETHVYVARASCKCVIGLVTDRQDERTAKGVAGFIADGLTVDRCEWKTYKDEISNEETFMNCPHGQLKLI